MILLELLQVDKATDVITQTQGGVMVGLVIRTEEIARRVQEEGGNGAKVFQQIHEEEVAGNGAGHQIL